MCTCFPCNPLPLSPSLCPRPMYLQCTLTGEALDLVMDCVVLYNSYTSSLLFFFFPFFIFFFSFFFLGVGVEGGRVGGSSATFTLVSIAGLEYVNKLASG